MPCLLFSCQEIPCICNKDCDENIDDKETEKDDEYFDGRTSKMSSGSTSSVENQTISSRSGSTNPQLRAVQIAKPNLLVKRPNRLRRRRKKTNKNTISDIAEENIVKYDEEHCVRFLCEWENVSDPTLCHLINSFFSLQ